MKYSELTYALLKQSELGNISKYHLKRTCILIMDITEESYIRSLGIYYLQYLKARKQFNRIEDCNYETAINKKLCDRMKTKKHEHYHVFIIRQFLIEALKYIKLVNTETQCEEIEQRINKVANCDLVKSSYQFSDKFTPINTSS